MIDELLAAVSTERIREHIRLLEGVRHPLAAPEALEQAAVYIEEYLGALPYEVQPHPFTLGETQFRNIVATRRGLHQPERRLIVLAHYDTVATSPGADDNASAVAVLLEMARVLQSVPFERTVQFVAVNLEERQREGPLEQAGLWGSRALVNEAVARAWQIDGVIDLEMLGYAGEHIAQRVPEGLPIKVRDVGDFIAVVGNAASAGLVDMFVNAVARHRLPLPVVPLVVPGNGEALRASRRSDHAAFWDCGYKAIMLTDTADMRSPHYHQPSDTLSTLNIPFAAEVCRAVVAMVMAAAA